MGRCWSCNQEIPENHYHRQDHCDHCGRDTHACKNCEHHDRAYNNECRESSAERVVDKEKANFCDHFKPGSRTGAQATSRDALKSAAEALFKKK
jgi:hypothetical protein